ncbi:MAG: hypothetical protein HOM52_18935, partial [Rhodospirillaceae bacterium]|nr:hypothetical protein [Rhodospirillaceae bacterium]
MWRMLAIAFTVMIFWAPTAMSAGDDNISKWLQSINLEKYEDNFRRNDITPEILPELTDSDLRDMGVDSLGARKTILKAIQEAPDIGENNFANDPNNNEVLESQQAEDVYSEGPCERPTLPNTVELSQIPKRVRDDIGRHLDTPLANHFRPSLLTFRESVTPNYSRTFEFLYEDPPYTIVKIVDTQGISKTESTSIYLPGGEMSQVWKGDYTATRNHIDYSEIEYIEPEVDVVIDGISAKEISFQSIWNMELHESSGGRAARKFSKEIKVVGSKEVEIEINGEMFRLKGFELKYKIVNQNEIYVQESKLTWVPYIAATVEWKTTKERW